jgi:hypothetical protein
MSTRWPPLRLLQSSWRTVSALGREPLHVRREPLRQFLGALAGEQRVRPPCAECAAAIRGAGLGIAPGGRRSRQAAAAPPGSGSAGPGNRPSLRVRRDMVLPSFEPRGEASWRVLADAGIRTGPGSGTQASRASGGGGRRPGRACCAPRILNSGCCRRRRHSQRRERCVSDRARRRCGRSPATDTR